METRHRPSGDEADADEGDEEPVPVPAEPVEPVVEPVVDPAVEPAVEPICLLAGLFDKDRCELPKRVPCGDCSFGYSRTSWRPWGTCCEARPAQAVPVFVPRGGYSPLDGMPYSTIPSDPTTLD